MTGNQILTLEGVKTHAQNMELNSLQFLDSQGVSGAEGDEVEYIRVTFIDGKLCTLSRQSFVDNLSDTIFKLRPRRNDS